MTFRTLLLASALLSAPALAADGGTADGGDETPDASAGNGGAEDMMGGACMLTRDCTSGFACVGGRCKYVGYQQASSGCNAAPGAALLGLATALALLRKKR
jgi:hypothetical protein